MEHAAARMAGWIVSPSNARVFLVCWIVLVLGYGLWRSRGKAPQDSIRPSGPSA